MISEKNSEKNSESRFLKLWLVKKIVKKWIQISEIMISEKIVNPDFWNYG